MKIKTWADCAEFHGHECGGLTIGYKAALYAIKLLNIGCAEDEERGLVADGESAALVAVEFGAVGPGFDLHVLPPII